MIGRIAGALGALLLFTTPASSAPLVVYGPGLDAADAAVAAKERLGTGDFRVQGSLADLTGNAPERPVVVGASSRFCTGESGDSLDRVLAGARIQVTDLDYAAALESLTAAVERLPCGAEAATADGIYELFFLQGFMHFNNGDEAAAKRAFAQAAALDRTREWPREYPPTARTLYLEALQRAVGGDPAPTAAEVESLSVDGLVVEPSAPPALVEGDHLLLIDGVVAWTTVGPRASRPSGLLVTTAGRVAEGIAAGDARYAPWLEARRVALGADAFLVLLADGTARTFRDGRFEAQGVASSPAAAPEVGPGIALVAGGGALLGAGLGVHLQAYFAAEPNDDGGVPVSEDEYAGILARNRVGFGLAVAGGAVLGTGIVVTIVSSVTGTPVAAAPWVAPSPTGVGFGVMGRF